MRSWYSPPRWHGKRGTVPPSWHNAHLRHRRSHRIGVWGLRPQRVQGSALAFYFPLLPSAFEGFFGFEPLGFGGGEVAGYGGEASVGLGYFGGAAGGVRCGIGEF